MDLDALELSCDGQRVRLQVQPFRVLDLLVERAGQVVTRDEFRKRVWPSNVFVDFDHGLNNAIARLREALGDSAENPTFIETLPRVGYRFAYPADGIRRIEVSDSATAQDPLMTPKAHGSRFPHLAVVVVGAFLFAGVAALVAVTRSGGNQGDGGATAIQSVAVLPVRDLSERRDQEYLAAGITDALVTRLAQSTSLRVVSRRAGERYKDSDVPAAIIAHDLDVDGIIDSALFKEGDKLRIDVQLVRATDDTHVWARSYEQPMRNVFQLYRQIADDIAVQLSGDGAPGSSASVAQSASIDAYDLYLQGRHFWNQRSPDSVEKSVTYFERAIALDPEFAAAYAGLAESLALLGGHSLVKTRRVEEVRNLVMTAAQRALDLDNRLPEAHAAMARATNLLSRSSVAERQAEQHYQLALSLNPAFSEARLGYGNFLSSRGHRQEAIEQFREGLLHDPLSSNTLSRLGLELVNSGQADEGITLLEHAVEIEPWQFNAFLRLGWTYAAFDRFDDAAQSFAKADQITSGTIHTLGGQAFVAARRGDIAAAESYLAALRLQADTVDLPYLLALVYVALGDREPALEWLEKAAPAMNVNQQQGLYGFDAPLYDRLRADPRFKRIVQIVERSTHYPEP